MDIPVSALNFRDFKIKQLYQMKYNYVKDLDSTDEKLFKLLKNEWDIIQKPVPNTITAFDVYQKDSANSNIVTFIEELDSLLVNSIKFGQLTEFCGLPGSGKSQISYLLCLNVQLPFWCGGVSGESVYLSTKCGFIPERFHEIASEIVNAFEKFKNKLKNVDEFASYFNVKNMLDKISFLFIKDDVELLSTINLMESWILSNKRIKLVVIDSITAPIRFVPFQKRADILNRVLFTLKVLASKHHFSIVLTNDMTTKFVNGTEIKLMPSFGSSYFHKINSRVQFTKISKDLFSAALVKSPTMPYKEIFFKLP